MIKKIVEKQKHAKIAKPQPQKKERLTIASPKALLGKTVSHELTIALTRWHNLRKALCIVCRDQTLMNSLKIFWLDIARCPLRDEICEQVYH
jgi:hypothetical protein